MHTLVIAARPHPVHQHRPARRRVAVRRRPASRSSTASRRSSRREGRVPARRCSFMIGLIASFFTIIYAYGRNTYSLSRAGYFPKFLSVTHGERKTPHVALIAGAVVGYVARRAGLRSATSRGWAPQASCAALLNMAVFAAVISYTLQMRVVRPAAAEAAEHRPALPQQVGRPGSGRSPGSSRRSP